MAKREMTIRQHKIATYVGKLIDRYARKANAEACHFLSYLLSDLASSAKFRARSITASQRSDTVNAIKHGKEAKRYLDLAFDRITERESYKCRD